MVTHARPHDVSNGSVETDDVLVAELRETRHLLALRTRERDTLQDERDALRERIAAVMEECDAAVAQWRQRCETSLDVQLGLAAALNTRPQADGHVQHTVDVERIIAERSGEMERIIAEKSAEMERIILEKNAYILHLESLLAANPISLLASRRTFRKRQRAVTP